MVWHLPYLCQMLSPGCRPYLGLLSWLGRRLAFSPRSFLSLVIFWKPAASWRHPSIPVFFIAVCIQPTGRATNRGLSVALYWLFWRICVLSCTISHWGRNSFERITSLSYLSKSKLAPVLVIMASLEELWDFFATSFHVHKSYCSLSARDEKVQRGWNPASLIDLMHTCIPAGWVQVWKAQRGRGRWSLRSCFVPQWATLSHPGPPMGHPTLVLTLTISLDCCCYPLFLSKWL